MSIMHYALSSRKARDNFRKYRAGELVVFALLIDCLAQASARGTGAESGCGAEANTIAAS